MKTFLIHNEEIAVDLSMEFPSFPKYTSQIINLANQNAQGTRPKVVGQMSELIQEFPGHSLEEWKTWYMRTKPEAVDHATTRIYEMVQLLKVAIESIDETLVRKWVTDLVINKTYSGLRFQESILKRLASLRNTTYRLATPEEESTGIDGYVGKTPISIKPTTYDSKQMLPETIQSEMVFYEKAKTGIKVTFKD